MSQPAANTIPFMDLGFMHAPLAEEMTEAFHRILKSSAFIMGAELEAFEADFAAYCNVKHAIGVGNGLDALHLIVRALDIGEGDEVIVSGHTFIATWMGASMAGARPVPVDTDPVTMNIDASKIEAAITPRTRAIMVVHLYGQPCDMDTVMAVAKKHNLPVIEDAAQGHGSTHKGRPAGSMGIAAGFSFFPGKNLGALGDAGAVVTQDDALAQKIRLLRNYGSPVKYQHDIPAYNTRLDALQAALLRIKLRHLDVWNRAKDVVFAQYQAGLSGIPGLTLPGVHQDVTPAWHLYVIRHTKRDALQKALATRGVQTIIHYPVACHLSKAYADLNLPRGTLPVSERLADTVLSLPLGPHLTPALTDQVIRAVSESVSEVESLAA